MSQYWFISKQHRRFTALALFTFSLAFVVILLGAYTRLTNAGLSCPDWPNCYGYITAPHTLEQLQGATSRYPTAPVDIKKAWTEMTHRYFAGTEGILILMLAIGMLMSRKVKDLKSGIIGISLIVLLAVQVMLGMLTVTEKLKPVIVLSHLLTGLSLLSVLWWTYLSLKNPIPVPTKLFSRLKPWAWLGLIIVALQITLGGWVSTHYAGLACIDFPYCNGNIIPTMQWNNLNTDLITIHMLHRIGAFVTALYLISFAFFLRRHPALKAIATLIVALVALQITLGILNILWLRPVWLALTHHAVAIFLLLSVIMTIVKLYYSPQEISYGS